MIRVVFLGKLADLAGGDTLDLAAGNGLVDWAGLLQVLKDHGDAALAEAVAADTVRLALNGTLLADREALSAKDGDEIALLPPVSGG